MYGLLGIRAQRYKRKLYLSTFGTPWVLESAWQSLTFFPTQKLYLSILATPWVLESASESLTFFAPQKVYLSILGKAWVFRVSLGFQSQLSSSLKLFPEPIHQSGKTWVGGSRGLVYHLTENTSECRLVNQAQVFGIRQKPIEPCCTLSSFIIQPYFLLPDWFWKEL